MIVLDIDAAFKAVEILRRSPDFSVRPRGEIGFIAQAGGKIGFGETSLAAVIQLFRAKYPSVPFNFFIECNPQSSSWIA
jgi:hypothetical protein